MTIDYQVFDTLDKKEVTKWMYHLAGHIEQDMNTQGRDFKISSYGSRITKAQPLKNKAALKRGYVIGKKLVEGTDLNRGDSLIGGRDMASCIVYVLGNEGGHAWPAVRSYVRSLGGAFSALEASIPKDGNRLAQQILDTELAKMNADSGGLATTLREIADIIEPIESGYRRLSQLIDTQRLTIVNQSNENTVLANELRELHEFMRELQQMLEHETDKEKQDLMRAKLEEVAKSIDS